MDANELRIGNLVFDEIKKRVVLVWGIEDNHDKIIVNYANGAGVYSVNLKDLKAISLSAERLLNFSFRHDKVNGSYFLPVPNLKMEIHASLFMKKYVIELHNHLMPIVTECDSVCHHIQNLYFALTNKELQINNL